jgi:hypothetical protein
MLGLPAEDHALYHKVALINVPLWEPCSSSDPDKQWIAVDSDLAPYPVKAIPLHRTSANRLYVIVQPDGSLWVEGSLYLFERVTELGTKASTASNIAGDLSHFMNTLLAGARDFRDFNGHAFNRPTYFYKAELKSLLATRKLKRSTANRKINSVIGFYNWLVTSRGFRPQQDMWEKKNRSVTFLDKHGFHQSKQVTSTDLTFRSAPPIPIGQYIIDGGKLCPLSKEHQKLLIETLARLGNPEMLLVHVIALTTGMRIQSILTLRHSSIKCGLGDQSSETQYALHGIKIGEGTPVDAKNGKPQTVLMPAWLHHKLEIYINSTRHKERAMKSPIREDGLQYLFLTRTGKPYYVASTDEEIFGYSNEKGSAIRQYITTINKRLKEICSNFNYQFHDLRASFGVNLVVDNSKHLESGKMNQLELLDLVRRRMNHGDLETSMLYVKFQQESGLVAYGQSDFEDHLRSIISKEMLTNESSRTSSLLC